MKRATMPRALQGQLGDDATEAFVYVLNAHQQDMTEDLLRRFDARTTELVQRFEARFDQFEQRFVRLEVRMDRMLEKQGDGFGQIRADMAAQRADLMKWMFIFWVGQAFVVLAYFRAGQYLAGS